MSGHIIREATLHDIPRIKEIRFAVKENQLSDPALVTDDHIIWFIENGPIWVWEQDKVVLGFSAGDPRDGSIWALFVDPNAEGKGIGSALFKCCCESLIAAGHRVSMLETTPHTEAARFYKKRGWIEIGPAPRNQILLIKNL